MSLPVCSEGMAGMAFSMQFATGTAESQRTWLGATIYWNPCGVMECFFFVVFFLATPDNLAW